MLLAEVMLWLMYIVVAVAIAAVVISEVRYVFTQKKGRS